MGDLIGVVEAAYAIEQDEYRWLRGILDRAAPLLDRGLGAFAHTFSVDSRMRFVTRATAFVGIGDEHEMSVVQTGQAIPPEQAAAYLRMSVSTMSEVWGKTPAELDHTRHASASIGAADFLGIVAINPVGPGLSLAAPLPEVSRTEPAFKRRWGRVAAHIAAAARMRQKLGAVVELDTPELARGALGVTRARGSLRSEDPDAALEAWRPLIGERWTLVEHADVTGTRRLVARDNAPDVANEEDDGAVRGDERARRVLAFAALGHPSDLVAYELGLDVGEVEEILRRRGD